ncbi:MAG TPA: hypothetical protein PK760_10370 [Flavobacteriales bacterium]|nr:hypothetical protein [Flavobacteriales bacterium]
MTDIELARSLKRLRRTVLMLQTELRHGHVDEELIATIEQQMENGIATDGRSENLRTLVDALRESTLTPRSELFTDTIRACEKVKDAIEGVMSTIG